MNSGRTKWVIVLVALLASMAGNVVLIRGYSLERGRAARYERRMIEMIDLQLAKVVYFLGRPIDESTSLSEWYRPAYEAASTTGSLTNALIGNDEWSLKDMITRELPNKVASVENAAEAIRLREAVHEMRKYLNGYVGATGQQVNEEETNLPETKSEFVARMTRYFEQNSWPD